jgi:alpha-glucuronidase
MECSATVRQVFCPGSSAILLHTPDELLAAAGKLTGREVALAESPDGESTVVLGTLEQLNGNLPNATAETAKALKQGGYVIENATIAERKSTVIVAKDDAGVLYGAFHLICLMQTAVARAPLSISSEPAIELIHLGSVVGIAGLPRD